MIDTEMVDSACFSFRHDFWLLSEEEQFELRYQARWWRNAWGAVDDRKMRSGRWRRHMLWHIMPSLGVSFVSGMAFRGVNFDGLLISAPLFCIALMYAMVGIRVVATKGEEHGA